MPIDFGGTRQRGISVFAYGPLRRHLGAVSTRPRVFDVYQMLAEVEPDVVARFGGDCVALNRKAVAFGLVNEKWKPWRLPDGTELEVPGGFAPEVLPDGDLVLRRAGEIIARMPTHGFYFDRMEKYPGALHPDLDSWEPPRVTAADLEHYRIEAERLDRTTAQVVAEVGAHLDAFTPGSGFVFASVHNIQANVPPENIVALFDTALSYPLSPAAQ